MWLLVACREILPAPVKVSRLCPQPNSHTCYLVPLTIAYANALIACINEVNYHLPSFFTPSKQSEKRKLCYFDPTLDWPELLTLSVLYITTNNMPKKKKCSQFSIIVYTLYIPGYGGLHSVYMSYLSVILCNVKSSHLFFFIKNHRLNGFETFK